MASDADKKPSNGHLNGHTNGHTNAEDITPLEKQIQRGRKAIRSFKAKANRNRNLTERFADWMSATFGTVEFLALNIVWFVIWIPANLGWFPGIIPFDPFPFGLLTMIVSLEAIILSVFVLISQNRAGEIDELREEVDYQLGIIAEQEITKVLHLLKLVAEKNHIDLSEDVVLEEMLQPTNTERIEKVLEKQIGNGKKDILLPLKAFAPRVVLPKILGTDSGESKTSSS